MRRSVAWVLPAMIAAASPAMAETAQERAFVEAVREVAKLEAEHAGMTAHAEKEERDRESARAEILRRRDAALGDLVHRLEAAEEAFAAHQRAPEPTHAELARLETEIERLRAAEDDARSRLNQGRARTVDARSGMAVLDIDIRRAEARLREMQAEAEQEEARLRRIEEGDAEELESLAHTAVSERDEVEAVLLEFRPAFKMAEDVTRQALSSHLPALYALQQRMDRIKTTLCLGYTDAARLYVSHAMRSLESFSTGTDATWSHHFMMADQYVAALDPTCSTGVATAAASAARDRIATLQSYIAEDEKQIEWMRRRREDVAAIIPGDADRIAELERDLAAASARTARFEAENASRLTEWRTDQAARRAAHEAQGRMLAQGLAQARHAHDAAAAPFEAELEALFSPGEDADAWTPMFERIRTAERLSRDTERSFADMLLSDEVARLLTIERVPPDQYQDPKTICIRIGNRSPFALKTVTFAATIDGRPLPDGIDFRLHLKRDHIGPKDKSGVEVWRTDGPTVVFDGKNRYGEQVPYLMPRETSKTVCAEIDWLYRGDNLRTLEALGMGNLPVGRVGVRIISFNLGDPTQESRDAATVSYGTVDPIKRYRSRLDEARAKALGIAPADRDAAGAVMQPDRDARVRIQQALIAARHLDGEADGVLGPRSKEAIRAWQAANGHGATGELTASQFEALVAGR